jgi:hypothetical protein
MPYPFGSTGQTLYVQFQSGSDSAVAAGIVFSFESVTMSSCSGAAVVSTAGATLGVDGVGVASSVYPTGVNCSWLVTPPPPSGLTALDVWYTALSVRCFVAARFGSVFVGFSVAMHRLCARVHVCTCSHVHMPCL